MSDTKENEEAGQGDSPVVDSQIIGESSNQASTSPQLIDDHQIIMDNLAGLEPYIDQEMNLEVQPEVQSVTVEGIELKPDTVEQFEVKPVTLEKIELKPVTMEETERKPVTVEETSKSVVENGSNNIENEKEESPAEDTNVKPAVVSEDVIQESVQDGTLHSVPVEADAQILSTTECEATSDMMIDVKELPQSNEGIDSDDTVCQNSVSDTPPKSDKSAEIENDGNVCQSSVGDAPPRSDKGVENDDNICQNSVGDAPPKSDEVVENDDNVCQNSVGDALPKSDKSVEIENDDNVRQNSVGDAPPKTDKGIKSDDNVYQNSVGDAETTTVKLEVREAANTKVCDGDPIPSSQNDPTTPQHAPSGTKPELKNMLQVENKADEKQAAEPVDNGNSNSKNMFFLDADHFYDGNESGTEEEQSAFMKELENFFRERSMEFKPPKFYGEGLNCLKLWRAVIRLGGYDKVTSCKLWRQVGESFKPPKTCTTVSWTFRGFYEKALLDYERHNIKGGELSVPVTSTPEPMIIENQASVSGRARRYAAEQAMRGWHSQRLLGNGEVSDPIIKDRNPVPVQKREKQLKSINLLKRKKPSYMDNAVKAARSKPSRPHLETSVVDIGPPADWVKVNVQKTKDCFEIYALVPGLLREEVRVQSDPAGRLVISGEPEHTNNPWGVTPFKKVVSLPSRIDPHQTSAVVTLHGQLFVRVPFELSE